MKDSYNSFTPLSWIAAAAPRNDGHLAAIRHCEEGKARRGNPVHSGRCENTALQKGVEARTKFPPTSTKAFSLIELLISLIVISLITAAFAPIYTKKLAKSTMTVKIADSKHGLMIYSNPGTYTFDVPMGINKVYFSGASGGGGGAGATSATKNLTFTTNQNWTVPTGVNKVTFTITAAGGGGGGGYAMTQADPCRYRLTIPAMANSGKDLCVATPTLAQQMAFSVDIGTVSVSENVCWRPTAALNTANGCSNTSWPSPSPYFEGGGCRKILCTHAGATHNCAVNIASIAGEDWRVVQWRLFYMSELQRLFQDSNASNNYKWIFGQGLDLGMHKYTNVYSNKYTQANAAGGCTSPQTGECSPFRLHLMDGVAYMIDTHMGLSSPIFETQRVLYTGTGGTGQIRCVKELNNWLQHSGAGGNAGETLTKTLLVLPGEVLKFEIGQGGLGGSAGVNGKKGGITKVTHKKLNGEEFVYEVQGALGGAAAASASNGAAGASGKAGQDLLGGAGGVVIGSAQPATQGGSLDNGAAGRNGATAGFGGGGGTCARGVRSPSSCSSGGRGANGKVDISYELITPGGGGGAGASVGLNTLGIEQEIEYKVPEGTRLVFTIGKGGDGGVANQAGKKGEKTTIMEDEIIFNEGLGGTFGVGGAGGTLKINTSKARVLNVESIPSADVAKGQSGESGQMKGNDGKFLSYGFDGGIGGTTFLGYFGGCGGGIIADSNAQRQCQTQYLTDAVDAKTHNAVKNWYGGQGGGGGGAIMTNTALGAGSAGADGFLRIRWGE